MSDERAQDVSAILVSAVTESNPWTGVVEDEAALCARAVGMSVDRARELSRFAAERGQPLVEVLGESFGGVLGCDYFSAYRKYMADSGATVQFCLAHLIREVRFLAQSADKVVKN